jgi:endogenous inhibitor of DNA gyrase (YacG/DUF329 family)
MAETIETQPGKPCPICGKPATERHRPFCTKRCADVDLNRWLSDVYVVPGSEREEDERPPQDEPEKS